MNRRRALGRLAAASPASQLDQARPCRVLGHGVRIAARRALHRYRRDERVLAHVRHAKPMQLHGSDRLTIPIKHRDGRLLAGTKLMTMHSTKWWEWNDCFLAETKLLRPPWVLGRLGPRTLFAVVVFRHQPFPGLDCTAQKVTRVPIRCHRSRHPDSGSPPSLVGSTIVRSRP